MTLQTFTATVDIPDPIQGIQGIPGIQGLQGLPGTNGTNGTNGLQGIQGVPGVAGVSPVLDINAVAAAVAKLLAPIVQPTGVAGTAPVLTTVLAQNGATPNLPMDYSYVATDAHGDVTDGGDGNSACIKVTVTGPWGGFQPSSNNGASLSFATCSRIVVSIKSPAAGIPYSMQFLKNGDLPIVGPGGAGTGVAFTSTKANTWERFSFLKGPLMTDYSSGVAVDVSATIFKGAVQLKSGTTGSFMIDNWGGM
jgi:hypothetical protein